MANKTGTFIRGLLKGKFTRERNGYVDRFIAVVVGDFERYGETQEIVEEIGLTEQQFNSFDDKDLKGRAVEVPIGKSVKYGVSPRTNKAYGFLRMWLLRDAEIVPVSGK